VINVQVELPSQRLGIVRPFSFPGLEVGLRQFEDFEPPVGAVTLDSGLNTFPLRGGKERCRRSLYFSDGFVLHQTSS
jgi:hypothetical protein